MKQRFIITIGLFLYFLAGLSIRPLLAGDRCITLSEGLKIVLKDNRVVKVALFDDQMAYQDALFSRSALLPQMNIFAHNTHLKYQPGSKLNSQVIPTGEKDYTSYGFDVYQTLFDFGKNLSNYRGAKDSFRARKAHTESIKRLVSLEFVVAYFNLLEKEKMIEVLEKEAESLGAYLKDIELLYQQGSVVENDLLPARVKLADVRQKLLAANNSKDLAVIRLNNILSFPLREKIQAQDIRMPPTGFPDMERAWESAEAQRPEIEFYNDQIKASLAFERAKAVENLPELFAEGGYSYGENKYMARQENFSIDLGAKMDLYDGGSSRALLLKERFRQVQLKEQKEKISEDIKLEIEDSYLGLKNACEKIVVASEALKQAEENVRFYRAKYNAGSATPTEVLEAITLQTSAQTNYCSADYEVKRGYAKLMYSMGVELALVYEGMESRKNG